MLVDCFTFHNEVDLLEFRLRLLYDHVDRFVLVEADRTFSGKSKPFYFENAASRFEWAKEKLVHHKAYLSTEGLTLGEKPADYDPDSAYFQLEYQQRNAIAQACAAFDDDAIFMLSDLDEIPSHEALAFTRAPENRGKMPFVFKQILFYYTLNSMLPTPWLGTVVAPMKMMRAHSPQRLRNARNALAAFFNGGWHLSYFGGPSFIANKIDSFAHQEFNVDKIKNPEHLAACIKAGVDLYGREDCAIVKPDREIFPGYFLALADENARFFFGEPGQVHTTAVGQPSGDMG